MTGVDLSVVIPTFNRAATLDRCLACLAAQTLGADRFEVVVADDASTDETSAVAERWERAGRIDFRYHRLAKGYAGAARNHGVRAARAERIVFLGDDVLAAPDLLQRHLDGARRFGDDAVLVGEVRLGPPPLTPFMRYLEDEGVHHDFVRLHAAGGAPVSGWYFYACNASAPRRALELVGGFDESIHHAFEDGQLGMRLVGAGFPLHFLLEATGTHVHPTSIDRYMAFLRTGRHDVARVVRWALDAGEAPPRIGVHPFVDRIVTDRAIDVGVAALARVDAFVPDRVRRPLYRALVRYERRRAFQAGIEMAPAPTPSPTPQNR